MAIENVNEIKSYLETNKDDEEVKTFVASLNPISLDKVKEFVVKDKDTSSWFESERDTYSEKKLNTWRQNNLQKLIDEEMKKKNPNLDEKDLKLQEFQKEIEEMKKENLRKDIKNQLFQELTSKKLPTEMIDLLMNDNLETSKGNIALLEKVLQTYSKTVREEILAEGSYTPRKNFNSNTNVNPYAKETFSLTQQMELEKNNPTLAAQFKSQINM